MIKCSNCSHSNPEGYDFCDICYSPLIDVKNDQELTKSGVDLFDLPEGEIFAKKYKIVKKIGRSGGFGTTYLVSDKDNNNEVVLKLLKRKYIDKKSTFNKLEKLMERLKKISHPVISNVLDYGISDGTFFVVYEYIEGDDLKRLLLKRNFSFNNDEIFDIFYSTTEALVFLHSNDIVHGDISPFNIIYNEDKKRVSLVDIGIKDVLTENNRSLLKQDGALGMSLFYTAPELIQGKNPSQKSDLYSLGAVMYEIACNYLPFKSHSSYRLVTYILNEKPEKPILLNPELPLFIAEPITKLLEKEPKDRFTSSLELLNTLKKGSRKKVIGWILWSLAVFAEGLLLLYLLWMIIK